MRDNTLIFNLLKYLVDEQKQQQKHMFDDLLRGKSRRHEKA